MLSHFNTWNVLKICSVAVLISSHLAGAEIVADFTGGDGFDSVDQYPGIAGQGWSTPWQVSAGAGGAVGGFVENSNPLNGGGNYLSSILAAGQGVQRRHYESFGDVLLTALHTISFDIRFDSDLSTFNASTDYFQAYDRPDGSDFGANGAWLIRAQGADIGGIPALQWKFYNGSKDGGVFDNNRFVDSGVTLVTGTVYHFEINIDPVALQYTVSINGGAASAPLGFRTGNINNLGMINFGGRVSDGSESFNYSLDSVRVAAVPEPSQLALIVCAAVFLIGVQRIGSRRHALARVSSRR